MLVRRYTVLKMPPGGYPLFIEPSFVGNILFCLIFVFIYVIVEIMYVEWANKVLK